MSLDTDTIRARLSILYTSRIEQITDRIHEMARTTGSVTNLKKPSSLVGYIKRVFMDDLFGHPWEDVIEKPAYQNLSIHHYDYLTDRADWVLQVKDREDFIDRLKVVCKSSSEIRGNTKSLNCILDILNEKPCQ